MALRVSSKNKNDYFICNKCHFIGHGEVITKGSRVMESVMWSIFLIPGPFYSLWRHMSRHMACPKCKGTDLISLESPEGRVLFDKTMRNK